jgi:hypothetical protein
MSMLLGGDVYPGDFLFARQDDGAVAVCQVHAIVPPRSMKIMWWIERDNGPPLCPDMFRNILECKVIELHPSLESIVWYDDVVDVAFVFRPEVLEKVWTDVAGMSRVFFTRSPTNICHCPVYESFPCRLWYSLLHVKEIVNKMLSSRRQMQMCKATTTTTFSLEAWRYLGRFFYPINFQKLVTKPFQCYDLSLMSRSCVVDFSLIRIMDGASFLVARDIFGRSFGIGSRNTPPRKGFPRKVLEVGNIVNIVIPSPNNNAEKFKEITSRQRIDLVYNALERRLTIRVAYSDVKAEDAIVADILKFPRLAQNDIAEPNRRIRKVRPVPCGTSFTHNDKMYTVSHSDGQRVVAVGDGDGEELYYTNDELWSLILDNL